MRNTHTWITDDCLCVNADCKEVLQELPPKSVDYFITSPPYNLGVSSGGGIRGSTKSGLWRNAALAAGYDGYNDAMAQEDYAAWQTECLQLMWDCLSDTGAIFYNHKPRVQNGLLLSPTSYAVNLPIRQIIIWNRKGGFNFTPSAYLPVHEYIILIAKPKFRLKSKAASGAKDVWEFPPESNNKHPAPFPLELPKRILETVPTGTVCDPFMGSGTTGVASCQLGFSFIGVERAYTYYTDALARIRGVL